MKTTILTIALLLIVASLAHGGMQIGTLTTAQRVLRAESLPSGNRVDLYAARNEWRSFQILIRSASAVKGITVEASDLHGPSGAVIPASSARLYREHQFLITKASYRNLDFKAGWYPDALIPFLNPVTGKPIKDARFVAVPFDLPANETHGFWIDVYTPSNARPGIYHGRYTVHADKQPSISVPVTLTVWDFKLPDTPSLISAYGQPTQVIRANYAELEKIGRATEPKDWDKVYEQCNQLLEENRQDTRPQFKVQPVEQSDGTFVVPSDDIVKFRQFIDKYHTNYFFIELPMTIVKDPVIEYPKLHAWLKAWDDAITQLNRPDVLICCYLVDEPHGDAAFRKIDKWGKAMKSASSKVKIMVTAAPSSMLASEKRREEQADNGIPDALKPSSGAGSAVQGAVDIWSPIFFANDRETSKKQSSMGATMWTYTAMCQGECPTPWWQTDFPLLNYQAPSWIGWRFRNRGLLYWGCLAYWKEAGDPWTNPVTFGPAEIGGGIIFNGEACLVYPGPDVGYDGIAPSMRLKALRDGVEDYEYLMILERAGKRDQADRIVEPLAESWYNYSHNPAAYEKARQQLAKLILEIPGK